MRYIEGFYGTGIKFMFFLSFRNRFGFDMCSFSLKDIIRITHNCELFLPFFVELQFSNRRHIFPRNYCNFLDVSECHTSVHADELNLPSFCQKTILQTSHCSISLNIQCQLFFIMRYFVRYEFGNCWVMPSFLVANQNPFTI